MLSSPPSLIGGRRVEKASGVGVVVVTVGCCLEATLVSLGVVDSILTLIMLFMGLKGFFGGMKIGGWVVVVLEGGVTNIGPGAAAAA